MQVGPGRNARGMRRFKKIDNALRSDPRCDGSLREKLGAVHNSLEMWWSPRRWQPRAHEPMQALVKNAVENFRSAIDSSFQEQVL